MTSQPQARERSDSALRAAINAFVAPAIVLGILVWGVVAPGTAATYGSGPDPFGTFTPIMLVLDTSDSMNEPVEAGANTADGTRLDSARSAALSVVAGLGSDQPLGLISYPGTDAETVNGCSIGNDVLTLKRQDYAQASARLRGLTANGNTPTGPALRHAADELADVYGDDARGVIMLFTDGESNCGATPVCDVAREIRAEGLEVQVNFVGFRLNEAATEEMKCAADATGGTYVDAGDEAAMARAFQEATQAALDMDVVVPDSLNVVVGTGSSGVSEIDVVVESVGRVAAADVRVSLVVSQEGQVGAATIVRPVRFLGNLATGDSRTVTFAVRPTVDSVGSGGDPGTLEWRAFVTATNATSIGRGGTFGATVANELGGVLEGVEQVVVLGDSYSSGEGNGEYDDGSPGWCHRNTAEGYAGVLFGAENTTMLACSGAVAADLVGWQNSGNVWIEPQLQRLRALMLGEDPPDAVFISIGGNDAWFVHLVRYAVIRGIDVPSAGVAIWRTNRIRQPVSSALARVDRVVNDSAALAQRNGQVIPIVVVPYPRIIPEVIPADTDACFGSIQEYEMRFLNVYLDRVNESVRNAVRGLEGEGRPIYWASDVVGAFQPNHTICDGSESWAVNNSSTGSVLLSNLSSAAAELLHPNSSGHVAMAAAVAGWSRGTVATRQDGAASDWDESEISEKPGWFAQASATIIDTYHPRNSARMVMAGAVVLVTAKRLVKFLPETWASISIESQPRALATVIVDEDGQFSQFVQLPDDLPMGDHTLVIVGVSEDGELVREEIPLKVLPAGGLWLYVMLGLGAVLLLVGLVMRPWRQPSAAGRRTAGATTT